jgi:peptidoglycan/LPS O-acetylase OafA/YrhL
MTEHHTPTSRIPQLELLRVMATAGIFVFHLWNDIPLSADSRIWRAVVARIPLLGTIGVIIFNCMAGFVLSLPYLGHSQPRPLPGSLSFFRQRFGRICQHYYPTLILWTIPWLFWSAHEQSWMAMTLAVITHIVFVHTLHISTFFSIVPAFWWLGMLAQFYLVYPWLRRFFVRFGPGHACILACVIPWAAWIGLTSLAVQFPESLGTGHYLSYFNLPVRLPEFAIGMWLAFAWNRGYAVVHGHFSAPTASSVLRRGLLPLLVGIIFFLLLERTLMQPLPHPLEHIYLVFWCLGIIVAILRWSLARRLGNMPLILDIAAASYGIYLLHQPLIGYANLLLTDIFNPSGRFLVLLIGIGFLCYQAAAGLNLLVSRLWR